MIIMACAGRREAKNPTLGTILGMEARRTLLTYRCLRDVPWPRWYLGTGKEAMFRTDLFEFWGDGGLSFQPLAENPLMEVLESWQPQMFCCTIVFTTLDELIEGRPPIKYLLYAGAAGHPDREDVMCVWDRNSASEIFCWLNLLLKNRFRIPDGVVVALQLGCSLKCLR